VAEAALEENGVDAKLDTVSGATDTSKGFKDALKDALKDFTHSAN
jgi:uncharacterized protein with FMN-binding domain